MPPVGHLFGSGGSAVGALGVATGPVTADDLDAGMSEQPLGEGLGGAFGQYLDGTAALHIDQDRAVVVPAPESEIINAQNPHGRRLGVGQSTCETQQGILTDADGLHLGQAGAGPAAQGERDRLADLAQQEGAAAVAEGQPVNLLGERPLAALGSAAEEPRTRR